MSDHDPDLTDADRKAIAEIRRELDAEFGPLDEPVRLDPREEPVARRTALDEPTARAWSSGPGIVAAFVTGLLLGAIAGTVGTLVWLMNAP